MSALAILRPDTLSIAYSDRTATAGGVLPKSAVADMEVVSETELTNIIAKFLPGSAKTSIPTVLAISDELCYTLPLDDKSKENVEKLLVSLTPFNEVATTLLDGKSQKYMVSTNQQLYESVVRALGARNHQVILIVPWMHIVQLGLAKDTIDMAVVKRVHDNLSLLRPYALPPPPGQEANASVTIMSGITKGPAKFSTWWIVFLVAAFLYAFAMYWFFIRGG